MVQTHSLKVKAVLDANHTLGTLIEAAACQLKSLPGGLLGEVKLRGSAGLSRF